VSETVVVAVFPHRYQAEIAAGYLKDADVPFAIFADDGGGAYPLGTGAQVVVPTEVEEWAKEVLVRAGVLERR
jgi:hypothetical protein